MSQGTRLQLTIEVPEEGLSWAILHINNWLAEQPNGAYPEVHQFVSALSNAKPTSV